MSISTIITPKDEFYYPRNTYPAPEGTHEALHLTKHLADCTMHIVNAKEQSTPYASLTTQDVRMLKEILPRALFHTLEEELEHIPLARTILLEYINHQLQLLLDFTCSTAGIAKEIREDMLAVLSNLAINLSISYEEQVLFPTMMSFDQVDWTNHCHQFLYHYFHKQEVELNDATHYGSTSTNVHHTLPEQFNGKKISAVVFPEGAHNYLHHVSNPDGKAEQEAHHLDFLAKKDPGNLTHRRDLYQILSENINTYYHNSQTQLPPTFDKLWGPTISATIHHFIIALSHKQHIQRTRNPLYHTALHLLNPIKEQYNHTRSQIDTHIPLDPGSTKE